jgi:phage protein U
MAWYFSSVRVYVSALSASSKSMIARIQPLLGGTVYQLFGYEKETVKVVGLVIGNTDLASLEALINTSSDYNLTGYGTDYGNYYLNSLGWKRSPIIYQTITSNCTDPVYEVDLELFKT